MCKVRLWPCTFAQHQLQPLDPPCPRATTCLLVDANGSWGKIRSLSGAQGYVLLGGLRRATT